MWGEGMREGLPLPPPAHLCGGGGVGEELHREEIKTETQKQDALTGVKGVGWYGGCAVQI